MKQGDKNSLPNGWEMKTLGEVAKVMYGYTEKSYIEEIGPKFLRITDIQNDGVNWDTVPYCYINDSDFEKYKLINGDIVFARTGATTGKSYLVINPPKSVFASYLIKLNIINIDLLPEFLFLYFQTKAYWDTINAGISGSAQGGFNATKLSELQIPFPPKEEQQRIVAKLDEAFEAIEKAKANAEQNLKNAKELFDSYLQAIFENKGKDWENKTLGEICSKITDGEHLRPNVVEKGIPFLSAKDVQEDDVVFDTCLFVSEEDAIKFRKRCNPETGDILIVSRGGTVGRLCSIKSDKIFCLLGSVILLKLKKDYLSIFVKYTLKSPSIKRMLINSSEAAAQPAIYLRDLKPLTLSLPPLSEQQTIVQKLDALSSETKKLEANYQKKLEDLEELKKSILQKAFSGQL